MNNIVRANIRLFLFECRIAHLHRLSTLQLGRSSGKLEDYKGDRRWRDEGQSGAKGPSVQTNGIVPSEELVHIGN